MKTKMLKEATMARLVPILGTKVAIMDSVTPKISPPSNAPGMLPKPPRAVIVKARKVSGAPIKGKIACVGLNKSLICLISFIKNAAIG